MQAKIGTAAVAGLAVGSVLSVLQQQPLASFTASSAASFVLLATAFSAVQETSRLVRCQDSPANSMVGGAGTGALLYKAHGQNPHRAVIVATVAGAAHWALARVDAAGGLRAFLISVDLLDPPRGSQAPAAAAVDVGGSAAGGAASGSGAGAGGEAPGEGPPLAPAPRPWWHAYLPVKKLTDAEWAEYKASQDKAQRQRIEAALAGGLPAMVERRQGQRRGPGSEQQG